MPLHHELAALRTRVGPEVFDSADSFRGALDDFIAEDAATPGEVNLLVDAIRLGALRRLVDQVAQGGAPDAVVAAQGDRLARERGTAEAGGARWALAALGFGLGLVSEEEVRRRHAEMTAAAPPLPPTVAPTVAPAGPTVSAVPAGGAAGAPDRSVRVAAWLAGGAILVAVIAVVIALLVTMGDDEDPAVDKGGEATPSATGETDEPTEQTPAGDGPPCTADDVEVVGGFGEKPTVTLPDDCTPPTDLITKDLVAGSGPEAKDGDAVLTDYLLVTWSDRAVPDNSFDRGEPFEVSPLGQAQVIQGWNEGLVGIQQGARRLIIVPPDKGYGPAGNGGIAPNETLVFVVDAVQIN